MCSTRRHTCCLCDVCGTNTVCVTTILCVKNTVCVSNSVCVTNRPIRIYNYIFVYWSIAYIWHAANVYRTSKNEYCMCDEYCMRDKYCRLCMTNTVCVTSAVLLTLSSYVIRLWNMTEDLNVLHPVIWSEEATRLLDNYTRIVYEATKLNSWDMALSDDVNETTQTQWTFAGSVLYSATVITTVGRADYVHLYLYYPCM